MEALLFFLVLLLLMSLGVPVAFALGSTGFIWILYGGYPVMVGVQRLYGQMSLFVLMAIPFFMVAGEVMNYSGVTERLVGFASSVIGSIRGGLAYVNIVTSLLFAGITGAAVSDVATLGTIFIPAMEKEGYTREYAAAITAASSIVGPIIPPSIIIVIYGAVTGVSVGAMFAAAIVPGLFIGLSQAFVVLVMGKRKGFPVSQERFRLKKVGHSFLQALIPLFMPIIILGGILGGVFTPTEAAAVAAFYSFIIGAFVYFQIKPHHIKEIFISATYKYSSLLLIMGGAGVLGWIVARTGAHRGLVDTFFLITDNPHLIMGMVLFFLLLVGMWLETGATVCLLGPTLSAAMELIGFHPLHFGILMIVTVNIGLITPPLGVCLFAASSVSDRTVEEITMEIWPYILVSIAALLVIAFFPEIALFLPRALGFRV